MRIGHFSGSSAVYDVVSRSGITANQSRARVELRQKTARVNNADQKEKDGTATDRDRVELTFRRKPSSE
jgi:hypothetical protein